jgi:hypothetical protein
MFQSAMQARVFYASAFHRVTENNRPLFYLSDCCNSAYKDWDNSQLGVSSLNFNIGDFPPACSTELDCRSAATEQSRPLSLAQSARQARDSNQAPGQCLEDRDSEIGCG